VARTFANAVYIGGVTTNTAEFNRGNTSQKMSVRIAAPDWDSPTLAGQTIRLELQSFRDGAWVPVAGTTLVVGTRGGAGLLPLLGVDFVDRFPRTRWRIGVTPSVTLTLGAVQDDF
jgi:hypothetical protein